MPNINDTTTYPVRTNYNGNELLLGSSAAGGQTINHQTSILSNFSKLLIINSIDNSDSPYSSALTEDVILVDATAGETTVNLPALSTAQGKVYHISKVDASPNNVVIDANGAEFINGNETLTILNANSSAQIVGSNTEWRII